MNGPDPKAPQPAGSPTPASDSDSAPTAATAEPWSSPLPTFAPGERVADRFRIVGLLGQGGMGQVYEAEDLELLDRVALKIIRPDVARDARAVERFRREVYLARKVTHPNVCRIFDLFRHRVPPQAPGEREREIAV